MPDELLEQAKTMRESLIETAVEANEELTEKYLEGSQITEDEIRQGLRLRTLANEIVPACCGTAFRNKGIQPVLDAVIDYYLPRSD